MYVDIRLSVDLNTTQELEWYVKSKLPELINEKLFENPKELNKLIKNAVEGQFRAIAIECLQSKEIKSYMTEKVIEVLKNEDNN